MFRTKRPRPLIIGMYHNLVHSTKSVQTVVWGSSLAPNGIICFSLAYIGKHQKQIISSRPPAIESSNLIGNITK